MIAWLTRLCWRLSPFAVCCLCGTRILERWAKACGWRWQTMSGDGAAWSCADCMRGEREPWGPGWF